MRKGEIVPKTKHAPKSETSDPALFAHGETLEQRSVRLTKPPEYWERMASKFLDLSNRAIGNIFVYPPKALISHKGGTQLCPRLGNLPR
jgi:hypothetical protein